MSIKCLVVFPKILNNIPKNVFQLEEMYKGIKKELETFLKSNEEYKRYQGVLLTKTLPTTGNVFVISKYNSIHKVYLYEENKV